MKGRVQFLLCHFHPLVPGRLDAEGFRSLQVGTDTLLPVSAGRDGKPLFALARSAGRLPLLAYSPESGLGRVVRALRTEALEKSGAEPVVTARLATLLKAMAMEGRGVAWLPKSLIETELREQRLVEAGPKSWRIPIEIRLFRRRASELPAAEAFWQAAGGT